MKFTATISFVAGLVSLVAAEGPFSLVAIKAEAPIKLPDIVANGFKFWVSGPSTATYCPDIVKPNCPTGKSTRIYLNSGVLSLDTVVPGGQQIYVDANGALGYTMAHSASIPTGAKTSGWSRTNEGDLLFEGCGFAACTVQTVGRQIVATTSPFYSYDNCIKFAARIMDVPTNSSSVWQYV